MAGRGPGQGMKTTKPTGRGRPAAAAAQQNPPGGCVVKKLHPGGQLASSLHVVHQLRHYGPHSLLNNLKVEAAAAAAAAAAFCAAACWSWRGVPCPRCVRPGQQHLGKYASRDALRIHRQPCSREVSQPGGQGQGTRQRAGKLRLRRARAACCWRRRCGCWGRVCHCHLQCLQDELPSTPNPRLRRQPHCQLVPGCH